MKWKWLSERRIAVLVAAAAVVISIVVSLQTSILGGVLFLLVTALWIVAKFDLTDR